MKRIEPTTQYDADGGYPSVVDVDLSRRGFLGAAVAGAAGLGAALLVPDLAEAGRKRGLGKVVLRFYYQVRCKHFRRHRVEKVVVSSYDKRLIAFLSKKKERRRVYAELRVALAKATCADVTNARRRSKLQRKVARALAAHYKKRTRRRAARPAVTLVIGRHKRRPDVDGGIALPSAPVLPDTRRV